MKYSYVVLCDLDETIIKCKSLIEVYKTYCVELNMLESFKKVVNQLSTMKKTSSRNEVNEWFYCNFKGINRSTMQQVIYKWLQRSLQSSDFFNNKVINKLLQHKQENAHIIVVSGSFYDCVNSICKQLPIIDKCLCIELESINSIYTGEILGEQTIGKGKAEAIRKYINSNNLSLKGSYAYGDHISDLPMLYLADNKIVVGDNEELLTIATQNDWEKVK